MGTFQIKEHTFTRNYLLSSSKLMWYYSKQRLIRVPQTKSVTKLMLVLMVEPSCLNLREDKLGLGLIKWPFFLFKRIKLLRNAV